MFRGAILAPATDESPSIWLYCGWPTDWMMSSAWKESRSGGPRVCRSSPRPGLWQRLSELLPHKLRERERGGGLRGCLMATLLLSTVGRLTVPDPFRAADKALAG